MALPFIDHEDPTKYQDMRDRINLDEKLFFHMQVVVSHAGEGEVPPSS